MCRFTLIVCSVVIALAGWPAGELCAQQDLVLTECLVKLQDDVELPAKEPGVLVMLGVREGSRVYAGEEIGKIDDSEALTQQKIAFYALKTAIARAEADIPRRYQEANSAVAEADYLQLLEANKRTEKAVTEVEIRATKLKWDQAELGIENATHDMKLAKFDAFTKNAEYEATQLNIDRCVIRAPFDGEVVQIYRDQDEWVNPGDPILRLVSLETMEVEKAIDRLAYDPHEIDGCEVTVEVELARGRVERVPGRITYVSSLVRLDGKYMVRAEVTNRQDHDHWILRDNMTATMTIHLGTGTGSSGRSPVGLSRAP